MRHCPLCPHACPSHFSGAGIALPCAALMEQTIHHLLAIWMQFVLDWGYLGILVMMLFESTAVPIPAEIVIPPAEGLLHVVGNLGEMLNAAQGRTARDHAVGINGCGGRI